jgi:signal transduction histidine kinase/ActR/RegA family two-component response regulator
MRKEANFFNFSLNNILSKDQSILDQARIRLLYYGFWIVIAAVTCLFINVYLQHQFLLAFTAGVSFVALIALFKYLTYRPHWLQISHAILAWATIINLMNVFVTLQKVDIITVQVILMVILFSFYMLGQRWGLIYSLLNLIPVLAFLMLQYNGNYFIGLRPEMLGQSTVLISIFTNFVIIIYIHSLFYGAFFNSIKLLKEKGEEQKQLNSQLELAIDKAEKSSQIKSEFLATMSHELRTPLNAVIGMSNLMMMANPRPDQKENLNVLKFSANNLLSIVNDVLDFNKIESGKLVFENVKFSLVELLQNIGGAEALKAKEKGLVFNIKIDPFFDNKMLFGDPVRMSQIIFNLLSNAIKFTKQGSILLKATCIDTHDNTVSVAFLVKDTGIGIEKSNLDSIFEPFTQESITSTRQYGGTGMGLAIVKRLLELQGLQMHVTSIVGEGSEFSFTMDLPFFTCNAEDKGIVLPGNDAVSNLRMLIAEDNPVNVLLMKKLLSKWNISPTIADNGERAIEIVRYEDFDIILMDLQMPVMNGFDAAKGIRNLADPKKAGIPIIALTATSLHDIKAQVLSAGMNDYVSKPFKPEDLMEKVQNLVAAVQQ